MNNRIWSPRPRKAASTPAQLRLNSPAVRQRVSALPPVSRTELAVMTRLRAWANQEATRPGATLGARELAVVAARHRTLDGVEADLRARSAKGHLRARGALAIINSLHTAATARKAGK